MLGMQGKFRKSNRQTYVQQRALNENVAYSPGVTPECPACYLDSQRNQTGTDQQCDLCGYIWCTSGNPLRSPCAPHLPAPWVSERVCVRMEQPDPELDIRE
jgi:hypothetical protein